MGLRLIVADSAAERAAARAVEARVFLETFGNTPETMAAEYDPYEDRSCFVVVLDEADGTACGVARLLVQDDAAEVKTLTDVAREPWSLPLPGTLRAAGLTGGPIVDVATLAVDARYRRGAGGVEVTLALCHGLYAWARDRGAEALVAVLDDAVLRLLQSMGIPMDPMPGATSEFYLGSPASTPAICPIAAVPGSMRTRRPDLAPAIVDGVFRTVAADPADLHPDRGLPVPS